MTKNTHATHKPEKSFFNLYIKEIKYRIASICIGFCVCSFVCFHYYIDLTFLFISPIIHKLNGDTFQLIYTSPSEAFSTSVYWCFFISTYLFLNILLAHVYSFIKNSLLLNEKRVLRQILLLAAFLWNFSLYVSFKTLIPIAISFFSLFETSSEMFALAMVGKVSEYQSFYVTIAGITTFLMELPLITVVMIKYRLIEIQFLIKFRKIFYFVCFVLAAIITPPDVIYQMILAFIMITLYEFMIIYGLYRMTSQPNMTDI